MYNNVKKVLDYIYAVSAHKDRVVIAIDGRCASGKTTLAAEVQRACGCNVIHADDFFLRPEQRTEQRLSEPGGNIDYERLICEVFENLKSGGDFSFRPYDCKSGGFKDEILVRENKITIVEGAYSFHPVFRKYIDSAVFIDVPYDVQKERIRHRNGDKMLKNFTEIWIPKEEQYFSHFSVKEKCGLYIANP